MAILLNALEEETEPQTLEEAQRSTHWKSWLKAMQEEYRSLEDNHTWTLVPLAIGRKRLKGKWVFKLKRGPNGEILRYKARWVVKGFLQKEGIDYNETFALVVKLMSYKALFAIAAALDLELHQMDVKTAFLYGLVEEDIYVEQPPGLSNQTDNRWCKLNKALYGLKQLPRVWYKTLTTYLEEIGFTTLFADSGVFVRDYTYIAVYVDDLLIAGPSLDEVSLVKQALNEKFQMADLGECKYYLGMTITRDRQIKTLRLGQRAYIQKVLRDLNFDNLNPCHSPMATALPTAAAEDYEPDPELKLQYARAIGCLMYAMLGTRPDIAFPVSFLSRHLARPTPEHMDAVKRVFRYLKGTTELELVYRGDL